MPKIVSDPETEPLAFGPPAPPPPDTPPTRQAPKQRRTLVPPWRDGPKHHLADHAVDDNPEDEVPEVEGECEEEGDDEPETPRRRWDPRGSGAHKRPTFRQPRHTPRQTPVEWWRHMPARNRWALYNGCALGAGFALHLPQWVTAETAYLVATYDSWTDVHVYFWYCVTALVWACDHETRRWHWALALPCRIPLISIVVGVLLYGTTDLPMGPK
ncbi:hypothetical protein ACIBSV_46890 [Embleya sp. NPDC050154]|uniref:hypothetical protein n=1 Tax=Embleya sp. NPDC050154 TaxID=3363988 RepID=UPI0037A8478F